MDDTGWGTVVSLLKTIVVNIGWATVILSAIAACVGTALGAGMVVYLQGRKSKAVRKTAISALTLLKEYADTKTPKYTDAQNAFNIKFNMAQKRSMLVALHKIGVPIEIPVSGLSAIENVYFSDKKILTKEIDEMIEQINNGSCDNLYFTDVDIYFSEGLRRKAMRETAKKFVNEIMKKSSLNMGNSIVDYHGLINNLTVGEFNVIAVFRIETYRREFYDISGNANIQSMDELVREIERGLWDRYLGWDYDSYMNNKLQRDSMQSVAEIGKALPAFVSNLLSAPQQAPGRPDEPDQNHSK